MNKISLSNEIMEDFANNTGLSNKEVVETRYLWTDSFAIFNYIELYKLTNSRQYLDLVNILISHVHNSLAKHREDDERSGWISGLEDTEAQQHPTIAGLRIGKSHDERNENEIYDPNLEWDKDGQYFHYLTKWMLALNCAAVVIKTPEYQKWAMELAKTSFAKFTYTDTSINSKQMYWKMSIDLSRPQVDSMGQQDPLDGLITYLILQTSSEKLVNHSDDNNLHYEIEQFTKMCHAQTWATSDVLGIGGLLTNVCALVNIIINNRSADYEALLVQLLHDIQLSLNHVGQSRYFDQPVNARLPFRELGLSIGLYAIGLIQPMIENNLEKFKNIDLIRDALSNISKYQSLSVAIEECWLDKQHQTNRTWLDHYNINNVMLATSLNAWRLSFMRVTNI